MNNGIVRKFKPFFGVFISLLIAACSNNAKNTLDENKELTFENYINSLDQIPLPFSHCSMKELPKLSKNYDSITYEKYKLSWASQPLGILYNDKNRVTVIDCAIGDWGLVPLLVSYDRNGNKIDSLSPYEKSGEGAGYFAVEWLIINADKTILINDSIANYSANRDSLEMDEKNKKFEKHSLKYALNSDGRFRRIK